jgi:anaerobic magnesium-protoporphyrin IX monomethyl ester cyclase
MRIRNRGIQNKPGKDKDINRNRILLLYPEADVQQFSLMPLSLLHLAQPLLEEGFEVEIIDQRFEKDFFNRLQQRIRADLICIGISCITGPAIRQVTRISEFIRERTDVPIVLGGTHATLLPEQTLESPLIDFIVIGKGESPFLNLVKAFQTNQPVAGFAQTGYKENGKIIVNRGSASEININRIPYHILSRYAVLSNVPIVTSYGCPYNCSFCVEKILHPQYRETAIKDVMLMIQGALELKPQFINFIDDNFLVNRKRAIELFSLRRENNFHFLAVCTGRVDEVLSLDDDALRFMKQQGLVGIFFGIESGSPRILKLVNKRITPDMVLRLNLRMKKEEIIPHYSFMAGFPTETSEDREETFRLMDRLKEENPQAVVWKINNYTPYPGTALYDLAVQYGFNPPRTFEEWGHVHFYSHDHGGGYDMRF